mgnify:CR=1 FL=1
MEDYYYIVRIKEEYRNELKLTTINKEFCGRFIHQSYGNMYFELNLCSIIKLVMKMKQNTKNLYYEN